MKVLVLNKAWLPVNIVPYKRIFNLLCKGHANCLSSDYCVYTFKEWLDFYSVNEINSDRILENKHVMTVSYEIPIPEIIILTHYSKVRDSRIRLTKSNILKRDKYICQYSGKRLDKSVATLDHVIPKAQGGTETWENLVCCCPVINSQKGDRTPEEAGLELLKQPKSPHSYNSLFNLDNECIPETWKPFLFKNNE